MQAGLFDALLDLSRWLTPEVLFSGIAAVVGVATFLYVLRDRAEREMDRQPRIALNVNRGSSEGWHLCTVDAMNRADSTVMFTKARAPKGFLLGRPSDLMSVTPIPETVGNDVKLEWHINPGPGSAMRPERRLFIKAPQRFWFSRSTRSIKLSFNITVHDASRREQVVKAITNSIDWKV